MTDRIPQWAMKTASPEDLEAVRRARQDQKLVIAYADRRALRRWARAQGWPAPLLFFEKAFVGHMLAGQERFALALAGSGVELRFPRAEVVLSAGRVAQLDALYEERSADGRRSGWGALVEELREIRRAVEAGVTVRVAGGTALRSWDAWYGWAHGRYRMLEDGCDSWIGDDRS